MSGTTKYYLIKWKATTIAARNKAIAARNEAIAARNEAIAEATERGAYGGSHSTASL